MSNPKTFSFLVTTDNHLGFKEGDHIRRKDSYMAFKEALKIARDRDVDFILLGGDLFHYNKPSTSIEHKCIKIIRQHMSASVERSTSFQRIGGYFSHFRKVNHANFEDQNFTVPYPIMTIHGNHDDPTGPNSESVCEKLATCGLLNYFGAIVLDRVDGEYTIEPIIFQKDKLKIALYGIGFIPDFKLKIAFETNKVFFVPPPQDTYNVLVVHQNRVPLNKDRYISDDVLPTFFHLIIRGHEHMTQAPEPISGSKVDGMVYQPGSTVATSIAPMEGGRKKVGLIKVHLNTSGGDTSHKYKMNYELLELKSCRNMLFEDVSQKDIFKTIKQTFKTNRVTSAEFKKISMNHVMKCIDDLLRTNKSKLSQLDSSSNEYAKLNRLELPLVRIRIEYTSKSERFDELELSSKYYPDLVANKDIVLFKKQKLIDTENGAQNVTFTDDSVEEENEGEFQEFDHIDLEENKRDTVEALIEDYFKDKPPTGQLQVLSVVEYTNAVRGSHEDGNIISKVISKKKKLILDRYKEAIADQDVEENFQLSQFSNEESVRQWFLESFGCEREKKIIDDQEIDVMDCD